MFARKASSKNGKTIPQDWLFSLTNLLNETYQSECERHQRTFDVYGQIYQEELLLAVSWLSEKDEHIAPITCFLSCEPDQMKDDKKVKNTQQNFIDVVGIFFDQIFASDDWNDFEPAWQEVNYKEENYFYKLSRENIRLTLEANKLLGDEFEDFEELEEVEDADELDESENEEKDTNH
ncbi:MAG: hypothetical protein H0V66_09015 [Bdellovibrionales bacterium]|nr:hypothetical protein [Bdellovibrionales bacterium]